MWLKQKLIVFFTLFFILVSGFSWCVPLYFFPAIAQQKKMNYRRNKVNACENPNVNSAYLSNIGFHVLTRGIQAADGINVPRLLFLQPPSVMTYHQPDWVIGRSNSNTHQRKRGNVRDRAQMQWNKHSESHRKRERNSEGGKELSSSSCWSSLLCLTFHIPIYSNVCVFSVQLQRSFWSQLAAFRAILCREQEYRN